MSTSRIQAAVAAVLLLSACGQAGPLYLPDQDTHPHTPLKRESHAKAAAESPTAAPVDHSVPPVLPGTASPSAQPVPAPNQP